MGLRRKPQALAYDELTDETGEVFTSHQSEANLTETWAERKARKAPAAPVEVEATEPKPKLPPQNVSRILTDPDLARAFRSMWEEGISKKVMCEQLGVSMSSLTKWKSELGLKSRFAPRGSSARTRKMPLWFTQEEYDWIVGQARSRSQTVGVYARNRILERRDVR